MKLRKACQPELAGDSPAAKIQEPGLVAEAGADRNALAADRAAAAEDGCAALGLHAGAESVGLHALLAIGLKCALWHKNALLFPGKNLGLDGKF